MGEQHNRIYTPMVYHSQGLQVILKRMPNDDSPRRYESIKRTTDRSQWQDSGSMYLRGYARETGVIIAAQQVLADSKCYGLESDISHDLDTVVHLDELIKHLLSGRVNH